MEDYFTCECARKKGNHDVQGSKRIDMIVDGRRKKGYRSLSGAGGGEAFSTSSLNIIEGRREQKH